MSFSMSFCQAISMWFILTVRGLWSIKIPAKYLLSKTACDFSTRHRTAAWILKHFLYVQLKVDKNLSIYVNTDFE